MISIVLADDHHIVRQGLRVLLEGEPDFSVVGEAADGLATVSLVERLRPDILIVDIMMPNLNGLEITRKISELPMQTRVIILSMYNNESYVLEALRNGAVGYVLKCSDGAHLLNAVRAAMAGQRYLSPPLSIDAIIAYEQRAKKASVNTYETLSNREHEVFHLVLEGHTNSEIANRLFISPRTVEIHRANFMRKLNLRNYPDLLRYALERGILPPTKDQPEKSKKEEIEE